MLQIQPCCTQKHWRELRRSLGKDGAAFFRGAGDLSLTELLPVILLPYEETEMMLVAPTLPDQATNVLRSWLNKTWARMDGKGVMNVLSHVTLITDLSEKHSPVASQWMNDNPFKERLTLCNCQQRDTAIILPDIAIYGNVNMAYNSHFTALVTKSPKTITELRNHYEGLPKRK